MNTAVILGILGAILTLIGLIPFLGSVNWISIILLLTGLVCGMIGIYTEPDEEKRGSSITGTIICTLFSIIAVIRLILGGGIL